MTEGDLSLVLSWRNSPDVRCFMYSQAIISFDEHQEWFKKTISNINKHLLIFELNEKAQGFISFQSMQSEKVAKWGFYLAPDAPKGTGKYLGKKALNFAFGSLLLDKVCAEVIDGNSRSKKFHKTLGFKAEGVLRQQYFNGGIYHDIYLYGLLSGEWGTAELEEL